MDTGHVYAMKVLNKLEMLSRDQVVVVAMVGVMVML